MPSKVHACVLRVIKIPGLEVTETLITGEVSERLKEHAWKVCIR